MGTIEDIANEARKANGNKYIKNNDLLWFLIKKVDRIEDRVSKTEAIQKLMFWVIPILITIIGLVLAI